MSEEEIKADIFIKLKDVVDFLLLQDNPNYTGDSPVDIVDFAKVHGITDIQRVPPEIPIDEENTVRIKHAVLIGTVIFLNMNDSPEKQRFSIAHEIYHFLIKRPVKDNLMQAVARQGETWKKANEGSAIAFEETIADYFAANLLIPTERFILWEDRTDDEIAHAFMVESRCIKKRREEIELELDLMAPKNLSSDVNLDEMTPLSLEEFDRVLEGHIINDTGRT